MRKRTREYDEFNGLGIMTEPTGTRYTPPTTTTVKTTAPSPVMTAAVAGATKAVTGTTVVQPTPAPAPAPTPAPAPAPAQTPGVPTYYPPTPISAERQAEIDAFNAKAYADALATTNAAGTTTVVQSPALVAAAQGATGTTVVQPTSTPTPSPAPTPALVGAAQGAAQAVTSAPAETTTPIPAATAPTGTVVVTPTPAASTPTTEAAKTDATVIVTEPSLGPTKSPPDVRTDGTDLDSEAIDTSYAYDTSYTYYDEGEEDPDAYEAVYDEGTTEVEATTEAAPVQTSAQPDLWAGLQKWWADLWKPIFGGK